MDDSPQTHCYVFWMSFYNTVDIYRYKGFGVYHTQYTSCQYTPCQYSTHFSHYTPVNTHPANTHPAMIYINIYIYKYIYLCIYIYIYMCVRAWVYKIYIIYASYSYTATHHSSLLTAHCVYPKVCTGNTSKTQSSFFPVVYFPHKRGPKTVQNSLINQTQVLFFLCPSFLSSDNLSHSCRISRKYSPILCRIYTRTYVRNSFQEVCIIRKLYIS